MDDRSGGIPALHALLIGIDFYLPNQIPGVGYYPSLGGCVRDISHVDDFLRNRLKLAPESIVKLTSTNTGGTQPAEPKAQWPTYENMVAALKKLTEVAQPGDQVYIHYSGHGGRAKTQYPDLKGPDGLDETLVPMDIGNSEARYLRDVELAYLLQQLVDKGLSVTITLDSCHSGGATRNAFPAPLREDLARMRGGLFVDNTSRPAGSLVAAPGELAANWQRLHPGVTRNLQAETGWLPEPQGYVLLAACRPAEYAYEYPFDGKESNGALTYWLLRALANLDPGLTYKVVYDQLLALIHSQFNQQTPILAGDGTRTVFGSDHVPAHFAVDVLQIDAASNRVRLAAGDVQGLRQGDEFALYPPGADFEQMGAPLAVATVTDTGAADAWATLAFPAGAAPAVQPGAQAVRLAHVPSGAQRSVTLIQRSDLPAGIDQAGALQRVADALAAGSGQVKLALPASTSPDYQVALDERGAYEIRDRQGQLLPLQPALPTGDAAAAARLVERLGHLARYQAVLELSNYDDLSPLAHKLRMTLTGVQDDYRRGQKPNPQPFPSAPDGTPTVRPGQWVFLRIQNLSNQVLNVAVLDLQPDWGIGQIFPSYQDFEPLDPGDDRTVPLRVALPAGYTSGRDILKAFATLEPTSFRWLEMEALDQPAPSAATRGEPRNPLEQLMVDLTQGQTRNLDTGSVASEGWTTAQTTLAITQP